MGVSQLTFQTHISSLSCPYHFSKTKKNVHSFRREFVSCVQSIKILSSAEVQQMSLDGDLGNVVIPNQACSGSDSGNAWRGNYDDTSAVSFNR